MKYNKGFNFSDLFFDKTNRSRLILLCYLLLFVVLIVLIRTNTTDSLNNLEEENNLENDQNNNVENDLSEEELEINKMFSYIDMNNYKFNYILYYNDDVYNIDGIRYDNKYSFELTNGANTLSYIASGETVKAKDKNDLEASFFITNFPYYYLNYFNNNILKNLLTKAKKVADNKYEITNEELLDFVDGASNFVIEDKEKANTIELELKNNIITNIYINMTNLFSFSEEIEKLEVKLNYSDFGLIDQFEVEI